MINQDNKPNIKLFQVTKCKSPDDFAKLDLEIIKLHCLNIKKKLTELNEDINISFGLIIPKSEYQNNINDNINNNVLL